MPVGSSSPDFAVLFMDKAYRKILEAGGYGPQLEKLGAASARRGTGPTGTPLTAEGSAFTGPAYQRYLQRSARRLDLCARPCAREAPAAQGSLDMPPAASGAPSQWPFPRALRNLSAARK